VFLEYEFYYWLVWIPLTYFSARKIGFLGILIAQGAVGFSIIVADLIYIHQIMSKPNWDGVPDMDLIFFLGIIARIFVVNIVLFAVALIGWFVKKADENT
jgi:hypothetical protein